MPRRTSVRALRDLWCAALGLGVLACGARTALDDEGPAAGQTQSVAQDWKWTRHGEHATVLDLAVEPGAEHAWLALGVPAARGQLGRYDVRGEWVEQLNLETWERTSDLSVGVDATGNVYVAAAYYGEARGNLVMLSSTRELVWNVPVSDQPVALALDDGGHLLVLAHDEAQSYAKVSLYRAADGTELWQQLLDGPDHESVGQIATVAGGFVVSVSSYRGFTWQCWTTRYDAGGNELWSDVTSSEWSMLDVSLVAARGGEVTVAAAVQTSRPGDLGDVWIQRYAATGQVMWTRVLSDAQLGSPALALGDEGRVLIAAYEFAGPGLITELDPTGEPLWTRRFEEPDWYSGLFAERGPARTLWVASNASDGQHVPWLGLFEY